MITFQQLLEKTLTPAEKKKREEIAKAMEKDNPDMPMGKKMAIATATAKRVAESDFEPHMMYDPKTGKSEKAEKPEDHERLKKKGYTHEKPEVKENYRDLARKGMGTETKKDARVGLELDFYETERGDKVFGKIIKVTGTGYTVQAMERGNNKKYTFKFHDRAKAKKLLESKGFMENYRAKRDAMRAMGKRGKDPADVDITATDDDRKAASKNILMQIRKATDLPKGGDLEFPSGKKGKISQDDAKKIDRLFNMLKRPADKEKFQKVISKDLNSIKGLLRKLGR